MHNSFQPSRNNISALDVHAILQLLREHAAFERDLHNLQATEASLTQTITFGHPDSNSTSPSSPVRCLLLYNESGATAGFSIFFYNYSSWRSRPGIYIEDLYIRDMERGKGYGKLLLQETAREALRIRCGRLEWSVACWNEASIRFYQKMGAKTIHGLLSMRVEGEDINQLADL